MGLENRDYAREGDSQSGWGYAARNSGLAGWEVWKKLVLANVIVFVLQIMVTSEAGGFARGIGGINYSIIQQWLELDSRKVLSGQIWRLVTGGFCHDRFSVFHILFNMLFLFWFGQRLEYRYGSREFAVFYFAALLTSSFAYVAMDLYTGALTPAIGASGAVWGVVALYALMYPHETINVYFLFPVPLWLLALVYFACDLHPLLMSLTGQRSNSGIAHAAHVGGAIFGFLYWYFDWRLMSLIDHATNRKTKWANSAQRQRPRTIPMHGPYKNFDLEEEERMDKILAKISAEGREALTDSEEEFLLEASKKIRDR